MIRSGILKFRIRLGIRNSGFEKKIRNYSRIPNYSEMAIPTHKQMCNQNFAKGGVLKVNFLCFKNTLIGWPKQSGSTQSCHIDRGLGAKPLSLGGFLIF